MVSPPGSNGVTLLLARASKPEQVPFVGNQSGGRVFLFLNTDDFWRDYKRMVADGIRFIREPSEQDYGTPDLWSGFLTSFYVRRSLRRSVWKLMGLAATQSRPSDFEERELRTT